MTPEAAPKLDPALAAELNHEIARHARLLHVLKSSMAAHVPTGLDAAAFGLLITLVKGGPRRQGELAEMCLLDPSTVSRHVGQLARAGYVERRPDPVDGRAVQLVASEAGLRVADEIGRRRQAVISEALGNWSSDDAVTLIALLRRLNDDLDAFRPHLVTVLTGQPATSPEESHQESTDQHPDPRTTDLEIA
jgi:MarR family transcriptional regulator, lower aerobic nicotinate degradation pathway regulator